MLPAYYGMRHSLVGQFTLGNLFKLHKIEYNILWIFVDMHVNVVNVTLAENQMDQIKPKLNV